MMQWHMSAGEAKMLARFSYVPEIVQIKNFFLANNTAYIVMEYVEGITLKEYVKAQGGKIARLPAKHGRHPHPYCQFSFAIIHF